MFRLFVVAVVCLMTANIATCQDLSAILKKVAERTRALNAYVVEGTIAVTNGFEPAPESKFRIEAADTGKKLHIEYQNARFSITVISTGSTIWTYIPQEKAYTKVEAATTTRDEGDDADDDDNIAMKIYRVAVQRYASLSGNTSDSTLSAEQQIKTAEGKIRCWVVTVKRSDRPEKLWIDEERFLVLRDQAVDGANTITLSIKRFDTVPPDESAFVFDPAKKVKLVDELDIPGSPPKFTGKPAADFALKNLDGDQVRLSDFRGKIVVLSFWATWCPPCRQELPTINKLAAQLRTDNVVFLGINDEGAGTVKGFNKKHNYTFTTLEDPNDKVYRAYRATSIPAVFVIGKDGMIVKHFVGAREEDELISAIHAAGLK